MLFVAAVARVCWENIAPARDTASGDFPASRRGIVSCWKTSRFGTAGARLPARQAGIHPAWCAGQIDRLGNGSA